MVYQEQPSSTIMEMIRQKITGTIYFRIIFYATIVAIFLYHLIYSYRKSRQNAALEQKRQIARVQAYLQQKMRSIEQSNAKRLEKEAERLSTDNSDLAYPVQKVKTVPLQQNKKQAYQSKLKDLKKLKEHKTTIQDLKQRYKLQMREEYTKQMMKTKQQEENRQKIERQLKIKEERQKQERLKEEQRKEKLKQKDRLKQISVRGGQKKSTIHAILEQPDQQSQAALSQKNSEAFLSENNIHQALKNKSTNTLLTKDFLKSGDEQRRSKLLQNVQSNESKDKKDGAFKMTGSVIKDNKKLPDLFNLASLPTTMPKTNISPAPQQKTQGSIFDKNTSLFPMNPLPVPPAGPTSLINKEKLDKTNLNIGQNPMDKKVQSMTVVISEPKKEEKSQSKQNEILKKDEKLPNKPAKLTLTSFQYFQTIMAYASKQTVSAKIPTVFSNLGGPKSSLNDVLIFATSFISSINKEDDKQLTSFTIQTYDQIIYLLKVTNLRDGVYRIPPKQKSGQVQKNSINNYVLMINLYRLMGYEKIWLLFFGKLLKQLEFIFKRSQQLKSFKDFELVKNGHMQLSGELQGRILSRMDNLTYTLLALTAFDPILIFKYIETKDPQVRGSRQQIQSWGRQWNYKQFWMLMQVILKKKNNYYFKPIIYINLLYVLYPRIYQNKLNKTKFIHEANLYLTIIDESKQFFSKIASNGEMQQLKKNGQGDNNSCTYDGGTFYDGIKVLEARICTEKMKQYKNYTLDEFEKKCNTLYYFCKEK